MNEWRALLRQSHPQYDSTKEEGQETTEVSSLLNVDIQEDLKEEALTLETEGVESLVQEIENRLEGDPRGISSGDTVELQTFKERQRESKSVEPVIEWISPTHKLQKSLESIPDKMGFKIGEAAELVGVKQYVLRYWETEFDALRPRKSSNGQRMYIRKDIETAIFIKKLLHEDRFSIEGARSALKRLKKQMKEQKGDLRVEPKGSVTSEGQGENSKEFSMRDTLGGSHRELSEKNRQLVASLGRAKAILKKIQDLKSEFRV